VPTLAPDIGSLLEYPPLHHAATPASRPPQLTSAHHPGDTGSNNPPLSGLPPPACEPAWLPPFFIADPTATPAYPSRQRAVLAATTSTETGQPPTLSEPPSPLTGDPSYRAHMTAPLPRPTTLPHRNALRRRTAPTARSLFNEHPGPPLSAPGGLAHLLTHSLFNEAGLEPGDHPIPTLHTHQHTPPLPISCSPSSAQRDDLSAVFNAFTLHTTATPQLAPIAHLPRTPWAAHTAPISSSLLDASAPPFTPTSLPTHGSIASTSQVVEPPILCPINLI
jgi:hypothetical protein